MMMLANRNNKLFKGLSVVLSIMIVALSLPFNTDATVSQNMRDKVLERAEDSAYDTDRFTRIYIGSGNNSGWDHIQIHSVSAKEKDDMDRGTDTDAKDIGQVLNMEKVYRTDAPTDTQVKVDWKNIQSDNIDGNDYVEVYYVDVPKDSAGIYACEPNGAMHGSLSTDSITDIQDGEFYYINSFVEGSSQKYILDKVAKPDLTGFTVNPASRTTFCRGDKIPFALNRSSVKSPIGNDFVYRFYYYKQGETSASEISQSKVDNAPYWITQEDAAGVSSETLATCDSMETGTYKVYMVLTDGYITYRSSDVTIVIDPAGELTVSPKTEDNTTPIYNSNGTYYYGKAGAVFNVHASNIAKVAYKQDPTDEDMASQEMWTSIVDIDPDTGSGNFAISLKGESQNTATKVVVRGYNSKGDIIQEKTIDLFCDLVAPKVTSATISTNDADLWKQSKKLQFVIEDLGDNADEIGSGLALSTDNLYLVNDTTGRTISEAETITSTKNGKSVTVVYEVKESGNYTVHYSDNLGTTGQYSIEVNKVDNVAPEIVVEEKTNNEWQQEYTVSFTVNKNVLEAAYADGRSSIVEVGYAKIEDDIAFEDATKTTILPTGDTSGDVQNYSFTVNNSGVYVIYARDEADNFTKREINLAYIDNEPPVGNIVISSNNKTTEGTDPNFEIVFQDPDSEKITISANGLKDVGESGIKSIEYFFDYNYVADGLLTTDADVIQKFSKDDAYNNLPAQGLPTKGLVNADAFVVEQDESYTAVLAEIAGISVNTKFIVYAIITDNAGNRTLATSNVVVIDSQAPTVTAEIVTDSGIKFQDGKWHVAEEDVREWYNGSDAHIKITGVDDGILGSGIAMKKDAEGNLYPDITYQLEYSNGTKSAPAYIFKPGDDIKYPVTLESTLISGEYDILILATDNAGNTKEYKIEGIKIDNLTPVISIDTENTKVGPEYDGTSGYPSVELNGTLSFKVQIGYSGYSKSTLYYLDEKGSKIATSYTPEKSSDNDGNTILKFIVYENSDGYSLEVESLAGLTGTFDGYPVENIKQSTNPVAVSIEYPDSRPYKGEWTNQDISITLTKDKLDTLKGKNKFYWQYAVSDSADGSFENWKPVDPNSLNPLGSPATGRTGREVTLTNTFTISHINDEDHNKYYKFRIIKAYSSSIINEEYLSGAYQIKIDTTAPALSEPTYEKTTLDQILEIITFGLFSTDDINVTLHAQDTGCGVAQFYYNLNGVNGGVSADRSEVVTTGIKTDSDGNASYTFRINKNYMGSLTFGAVDALGHSSDDSLLDKDQFIVIDSAVPAKPILDVKSDGKDITSGQLTNKDIIVTVTPGSEPASGVEGFYISETDTPDDAEKLSVREVKEDKEISLSGGKTLKYNTVTSVAYEVTADINKTYYFFTKSNVGSYSEAQPFTFNVDKTAPQITKFEFATIEAEIVEETVEKTSYGFFFNADTSVKIYATDDFDTVTTRPFGSGLSTITVWLVDSNGATNEDFGEKVLPVTNGYAEVTIPADFKGNIMAYANDNATNKSEEKHPYGTIVESNARHQEETNHIEFVSDATDNFVNETTNLTVTVNDTYSGIKSVKWSITVDGEAKAEGTADTDINGNVDTDNTEGDEYKDGVWSKKASDINLVTQISRTFALAYDSNNVVVNVTMTDNAGNTTEDSYSINIDKTRPVVTVSYDNNSVENNKYFKENRTVTFDIYDLNFDETCAQNVVISMQKDGADYNIAPNFVKNNEGHYVLTHELDEGVYNFTGISCSDLAGNTNNSYKTQTGTVAQSNFVIDKTKPVVTISYDNQSHDNTYFKADRTVTVTVSDYALLSSGVNIEAAINGKPIGLDTTPFNIDDAASISTIGSCTWQYTFSVDGQYTFNVESIKDKAGNSAEISYGSNECANEFWLDKTAPKVDVRYIDSATLQMPNYFKSYRTAQITVTESNFDPKRISANITAVDLNGVPVADDYINDLKTRLADINNWTKNNEETVFTQNIILGADQSNNLVNAIYNFGFIITDKAGNKNTDIDRTGENGNYKDGVLYNSANAVDTTGVKDVNTEFVIDGEGPTNLEIEVSDNTISKILNVITGGLFFNKTIDVTLRAEDGLSGVSKFVYTINYDKVEGSSLTEGNGIFTKEITTDNIVYDGNKASATFQIEPQFRGYISFYAVDRAASESETYDPNDKQVVVDTIPPVVSVEFDNTDGKLCAADNKTYYDADRTVTIKVTETNFFAEDIKIRVNGEIVTPNFVKDESGSTPVYTAEYMFDKDGEYDFTVEYNDRSNNSADINGTGLNRFEEKFIVDKTDPIITVSYDNNDGKDGFFGPRTATIKMEEANFVNTDDVKFQIGAWDVFGDISKPVPSQWSAPVSGISIATIEYMEDGNYSFDISYTDPAGRNAVIIWEGDEKTDKEFTIDTEAPYDAMVSYNDSAFRKFINTITGGLFFKDTVTVKVRVNEKISGIQKIEYECDVASGASDINDQAYGTINKDKIKKLDSSADESLRYTYEAEFRIQPNYRGNVKVKIYDNAGNITEIGDTTDVNELVVDDQSPVWGQIKYAYSGSNTKDGITKYYFNKQITGTLEINEANFDYKKNLDVSITKDGNPYDASKLRLTWTAPANTKSDKWTAKFEFGNSSITQADNGEYVITLNYTDIAGNKAKEYVSTPLVIDTVKPKFEVSYDNNSVKNDKYFPKMRTATLVITEPNIKAEDIAVTPRATNPNDSSVENPIIGRWVTIGNKHTATIVFDENAHYTLDIKCSDLAGNSINLANVEFGDSKAGTDFVVDKIAPTGSITVGDWSASVNGTIWDKIISTITFGLYTRDNLSVTIKSDDNLSGVNTVGYIVSASKISNSDLRTRTDWQRGKAGSYSFTLSKDKQFIVYAKIVDKADNVKYISTDGIIIDQVSPEINGVEPKTEISLNPSSDVPETNANGDMIFNGNIVLDVKVTDVAARVNNVDVYSGLQSVTYQVISNGVETQSGTLTGAVDLEKSRTTGLIHSQSDTITISADRNNTNNIRLIVTAIDNVGNRTVNEQDFMIDITEPEISVSYDNDSPDTMGAYFKGARTATVTITERNFNPDKVVTTIRTQGGTIPRISEWTTIEGSTPDDTRHRATLVYSADGDYTFDITYTDEAGNKAGNVNYGASVAPREFTIDRTLPAISISYDNNNSSNSNYFNSARTATITIVEHNFETSRITVSGTASDDGLNKTFPRISNWTTSGDRHYATITFTDDAEYKFVVDYTDKAGNKARTSAEQNFYIDNINPVITIDGVEGSHAYGNGSEVAPIITFTDKNFDPTKINITLKGSKLGNVAIKGSYSDVVHGKMFVFDNIEAIPENDDIYTLSATIEDLSGRTFRLPEIKFSVNRFGSTYEVSDDVKKMTKEYYVQQVEDNVVIVEYNVDAIDDYVIEVSKNGNTAEVLTEGTHFTVKKEHDDGNWTKYTYVIDKSVFDSEGTYAIVLKSKDAAENSAYSDLADTDLKFVVDRTVPTVSLSGIADGGRYKVEAQTVKVLVKDDNRLGGLKVIINGTDELTWTVEELEELDGEVTFTLQNSSNEQNVQVICIDAAGNETNVEVNNIIVSTSSLVQIYNNSVIFYGALGILAAIIIISIIIILIKRRKKDEEEEISVDDLVGK